MKYADPWPRIEFYVRQGLVVNTPTPQQLREASRRNFEGFGIAERLSYYMRHPLEALFPTKRRKQVLLRTPIPEMVMGSRVALKDKVDDVPNLERPNAPLLDQALTSIYQFPALRFVTSCFLNPYFWPVDAVAGTGLTIPLKYLISHVCHVPHYTALWDVQVIHADEGGLDQLEHEIEVAVTGRGPKARLYRAMTQSMSYYDYLRDLVPRVRRFDYPSPPPGYGLRSTDLVVFLNYAATL
jgi:hypothetical protein